MLHQRNVRQFCIICMAHVSDNVSLAQHATSSLAWSARSIPDAYSCMNEVLARSRCRQA
jgi:ribosomal protein L44E